MIALAAPSVERSQKGGEAQALQMGDLGRIAFVRETMGRADPALQVFPQAIREMVFEHHRLWVEPLILRHWPECLEERAGRKLRFLSCNLYATAPYTVLFAAHRAPWPVAIARFLGTALRLRPASLAGICSQAATAVGNLIPELTKRRIILISSFIATIDHVYDNCFGTLEAEQRGRRMRGLLNGEWSPDATSPHAGAFRLVRALFDEMSGGLETDEDRIQFGRAVESLREYIDAEVNAMIGVPDPTGNCWRIPGVRGTIDGLIFPVHAWAGELAREWMYSVSLFVQVLDDFLDAEKDAADIRPTPILTGTWTKETLASVWQSTLDGVELLARQSGIADPRYLEFVRETYRMMAIETADAMSGGSAA